MGARARAADIYDNGEYRRGHETWHAEDSPYKAGLVAGAILRNRLAFDECVDVGCGAGLVTELLARRFPGQRFVGSDVSRDAQGFWPERAAPPNLRYSAAPLLDCARVYDLALCLDVFEHVEDYFGFLRKLRARARTVIFNIPLDMNVLKVLSGMPHAREKVGHLHYFSRYTALKTLEECGYRIVEEKLAVPYFSTMPRSARQWAILPVRMLGLLCGRDLASRVLGGASLLVTASGA
jgi:SAM-dependent methyltransferase